MTAQTIFKRFTRTKEQWEQALESYTDEQFLRKPDADSWSVGQVYVHLTQSTLRFHLKQVEQCLTETTTHVNESKTFPGNVSFLLGSFPPVRIKVPPSPEYTPKQPENREQVRAGFAELTKAMQAATERLAANPPSGKTKHPRLGYFSALEWFRLIEMHFRHHLRQKERLDKFLQA